MWTGRQLLHRQLIIASLLISPAVSAMTLEEAWQQATQHSYRIQASKSQSLAAEQQLSSAKGQRLPSLNISGGYTQLSETPSAETQIGGQTARFPINQPGSGNAQAIISVPVFTSGRISHQIDSAKASLKASQQQLSTTVLDVRLQVAQAYINVLRAEAAVKVAENHVASLNAHVEDVSNLFEQGMVARNDLLAAQVERANARQQVVQAKNQLDLARAQFNQLLTRPLNEPVELSEQFPPAPGESLEALTKTAYSKRPELVLLSHQIESLRLQAKSIKSGLLPQVAVNGGYQYQQNRYQAFEGMWMVNANMNWKLFDGSTRHQAASIQQQANALEQQKHDLRNQISLQVRQAWLDMQEAQKRIKVTRSAITQAEENLKVTTDRYQQGLSIQTDVLKAEELRTLTINSYNNARFDYQLAVVRLRRSTGL